MPRNEKNDCAVGRIITGRLAEMERSQMWLARKTDRTTNIINEVVKGRRCPSIKLLKDISDVIEVDCLVLVSAVLEEV